MHDGNIRRIFLKPSVSVIVTNRLTLKIDLSISRFTLNAYVNRTVKPFLLLVIDASSRLTIGEIFSIGADLKICYKKIEILIIYLL